MAADASPYVGLAAVSFLEYAFLRWVLAPATRPEIVERVRAQRELDVGERSYRLDYEIVGSDQLIAVELDGFE